MIEPVSPPPEVPKVDPDYQDAASMTDPDGRDIYARRRSSGPAYTREDPPGTVRETYAKDSRYDKVRFPLMKQNALSRMDEQEIKTTDGTLWRLQQKIFDLKFELLKRCVAAGEHMVTDITAEVVIELSCKSLTNKAGAVVRIKDPELDTVLVLLPNGDFRIPGGQ